MILAGVLAFAWGLWLGMPGRYTQDLQEIDDVMAQGGRRRRSHKKRFTPYAWMQRQLPVRTARKTRGFSVRGPEDL